MPFASGAVSPLDELRSPDVLASGAAAAGSSLLSVFAPSSCIHCCFSAPVSSSQCLEPPWPYCCVPPAAAAPDDGAAFDSDAPDGAFVCALTANGSDRLAATSSV